MMACNNNRSAELRDLTTAAERLPPRVFRELLSLAQKPDELQELSDIASQLSRDELHDLCSWVHTTTRTGSKIT
ncbi:MAG TPA: hypothetical protein VMK12_21690 [Anaeromyxobacteraceae bacterium]|nr:hypothetical protein [Anaeromyxobacteraceae bacterium]